MTYVRVGPRGEIPFANRPMIVFNGLPYRKAVITTSLECLPVLGDRVQLSWLDEPQSISGEFGRWYNDQIEWLQGHQLQATWSLRPSGRPLITVTGLQSGVRIEKLLPKRRWVYQAVE